MCISSPVSARRFRPGRRATQEPLSAGHDEKLTRRPRRRGSDQSFVGCPPASDFAHQPGLCVEKTIGMPLVVAGFVFTMNP